MNEKEWERLNYLNYYYLIQLVSAEFVYELRNSLSSLKILFQAIFHYLPSDEESMKAFKIAEKEISRLDKLTKNFLSIIRKNQGDLHYDNVNTEIGPAVEDVLYLLSAPLQKMNVKVNLSLQEPFTTVSIPEDKLKQILLNIIINAKDAFKGDFFKRIRTPVIKINGERVKKKYVIEIEDNGVGVEKRKEELIFQPFYSTKGRLGLGLSISRKILDNYKGSIRLKSQNREGATFVIELPVA